MKARVVGNESRVEVARYWGYGEFSGEYNVTGDLFNSDVSVVNTLILIVCLKMVKMVNLSVL